MKEGRKGMNKRRNKHKELSVYETWRRKMMNNKDEEDDDDKDDIKINY